MSLKEGAEWLTAISLASKLRPIKEHALKKAANVVKREAQRVLGTYEYGWAQLAESTRENKTTGDSPGLETGHMKRSVKVQVISENEVIVGTNDPHALYFELGTSRQPPRPWLSEAAHRKAEEVKEICGRRLFGKLLSEHPDFEDQWSYDGED